MEKKPSKLKALLSGKNKPKNLWNGMPEYVSKKQEEYQKVIIRFRNQQDVDAFSKLIGQKVNPESKSIWWPRLQRGDTAGLRYVDGSIEDDS